MCRQLRLNEFVNVYNYINQQSEAIKVCQAAQESQEPADYSSASACASNLASEPAHDDDLKKSRLYDS